MGLVEILDAVELVFLRWHRVVAAEEQHTEEDGDMEKSGFHGAKIVNTCFCFI